MAIKRTFFVVDYNPDKDETLHLTQEIFDDYTKAVLFANEHEAVAVVFSEVDNWYQEEDGAFNYDDNSDTFNTLFVIRPVLPAYKDRLVKISYRMPSGKIKTWSLLYSELNRRLGQLYWEKVEVVAIEFEHSNTIADNLKNK